MTNTLGTEAESTAEWLEARGAAGAARFIRRLASHLAATVPELSAVREQSARDTQALGEQRDAFHRESAQLRTEIKQFRTHAGWAGWIPDPDARRLWRWRDGWWELGHRKSNAKDGYPDTGWYLWGPTGSGFFGEWTARIKGDATTEAERMITRHLADAGEEASRG